MPLQPASQPARPLVPGLRRAVACQRDFSSWLTKPAASLFLGAIPIALSTINNGIVLVRPPFPTVAMH